MDRRREREGEEEIDIGERRLECRRRMERGKRDWKRSNGLSCAVLRHGQTRPDPPGPGSIGCVVLGACPLTNSREVCGVCVRDRGSERCAWCCCARAWV